MSGENVDYSYPLATCELVKHQTELVKAYLAEDGDEIKLSWSFLVTGFTSKG
jgi:hypothetical protein